MKLQLLSLAGLLATSHQVAAQVALPAADKEAIVATLQHFQRNLNDHKFSEMTTYTTPEVTSINIVGMLWQGEPAVQKGHQAVFDTRYKDMKFPPLDVAALTFQPLTPEVVVVTKGSRPLPPGVPPHPKPPTPRCWSSAGAAGLLPRFKTRWLMPKKRPTTPR
jgi:hypothetical protein